MLMSPRSPVDLPQDSLMSSVIRQSTRTPRSHRHRFPSLSEFPDSPSIYSHAYPSPDASDVNSDTSSHLDDTASFDYDEETASIRRSFPTENAQDDSDVGDYNDDSDDDSHRVSVQGPKIRFHSRPPWETEEPPIAEDSDSSSRSGTIGRFKKSKPDSLIRTFSRATSIGSRPSVDSARSQISVTPSFEITAGNYSSSRGALYALAKESLSTASLSSNSTPASYPHASNYPHHTVHSSLSRTTVEPAELACTSVTDANIPIPASDISRIGHDRSVMQSSLPLSQEQSARQEFVHPYANPDLVSSFGPGPAAWEMTRSDSTSTVTDSMSTRSGLSSVMSTETSATSLTSRELPYGSLRVNGREISSPITVLRPNSPSSGHVDSNTKFLSIRPPPAGFQGHRFPTRSSTLTLISLQEAQARERSRGSTIHTTIPRPSSSSGREDGVSQLPFPSSDSPFEEAVDPSREASVTSTLAHSRVRSTSAGVPPKIARHPLAQSYKAERRDSDSVSTSSGARQLKHKKSGFMRLFSGRNSEGDPPPPIPSLTAERTRDGEITAKASKFALPMVSKPLCSPTLHSAGGSPTTVSDGDDTDGKGLSSRKRQPPSLSIVTGAPDSRAFITAVPGSPTTLGLAPPPFFGPPQSAPPGTTDFQALKLRPVSTSFSSHFADIIASTEEHSQSDVRTPSSATSPGTAAFPFTPVSMRRSDDTSVTVETVGEQAPIIRGLQDQLISAKQAWQQQIWELRGQVRDLTAELEKLREADKEYCEVCGRGNPPGRHPSSMDEQLPKVGVINRPRTRTGDTTRFARSK